MTRTSPPDFTVEDFYASSHPVRRFVAVLIAAALVLLLVWWTGLLAPRLSSDASSGHFDLASRSGVLEVEVRNESLTQVRIQDIEIVSTAALQSATVDGQHLDVGPEISGSSTAVLRLEYQADACIAERQAGATALRLNVRTVVGVTKTEHLYAVFPRSASQTVPC